jgi:L-lactate dehydrogenase complex protein LldG
LDEPTDLSLRAHDEAPHEQGSRRPYCEPATADPWRRTGETGALDAARDPECSQDVFIKRVRDALGAVKADALAPNRQRARLLSADEDLTAKFVQRLTELKVVVHHVDEAAAIDAVVKAVGEIGAKSAVMTDEGLIGASRLRDVLSTAGCALTVVDQNDGLTPSFEADVGITGAELAIAETGTVILTSGGSRRRLVGLAPPAHVILVPTDRIVADLLDWSDWYTSQPLHACQTMITGPSKTADIELTLVTGMHAPGVVHVVLIDQVPS